MVPASFWSALLDLAWSWLLTLPIAWHRERRHIGLRTFPLVAVASCGFLLMGLEVAGEDPNARARLIQGLMTGIGFVGGGAILKEGSEVRGTSTAAAVWGAGAIGGSVAFNRIDLAAAIAVVTFVTFLVLTPLEGLISRDDAED